MKDVGIFYGHLVSFATISYIFGHLVYFMVIWYRFPVLESWTKKNMAALEQTRDFFAFYL
jgi:hypothetical protein